MQLVLRRRHPVVHYVLIDEHRCISTARLLAAAERHALRLALQTSGDCRKFTLIHNGSGMARRPLPHVHIICARTRWQKALVYLFIGLRNLLPAG